MRRGGGISEETSNPPLFTIIMPLAVHTGMSLGSGGHVNKFIGPMKNSQRSTHIHTPIHIHTPTHTYTRPHTHTHAPTHIHTPPHTYTRPHTHLHAYIIFLCIHLRPQTCAPVTELKTRVEVSRTTKLDVWKTLAMVA